VDPRFQALSRSSGLPQDGSCACSMGARDVCGPVCDLLRIIVDAIVAIE
jgi:hypothetical protein